VFGGFGFGAWATTPKTQIPKPQSPIPKESLYLFNFTKKIILKIII